MKILRVFLGILCILTSVSFFGVQYSQATLYNSFRVTTYEIEDATFAGAAYTLTLNNDLKEDYFAMITGPNDQTGSRGPDDDGVRVTADPHGNFGVSTADDQITIARSSSANDWIGAITIVECMNDCAASGFRLSEVKEVTFANGTANATQTVTTTLGSDHTNQTVPFTGRFGGGFSTTNAGLSNNFYGVTLGIKLAKTGTDQLTFSRYGSENRVPQAGTATVYVVEWGSEWDVQTVNVTGNNAGNGINAAGEYNTAAITNTVRDDTWVWGSGVSRDDGLGDGSFGQVVTLGNGVAQNANETTVAVGAEGAMIAPGRDFQVYVFEHADLAVDHRFKTDGDTGAANGYQELTITTDSAVDAETYSNASMTVRTTEGTRFPIGYMSSAGVGQAYSRAGGWAYRPTADTTTTYWRAYSGQAFAGWLQMVDFGSIETNAAPTVNSVSIDGGAATVDLTAGDVTTVSCIAEVIDLDGFGDVTSVTADLYRTSIGSTSPLDNNNHYRLVGDTECIPSAGSGTSETYTCDFDVEYYADPTSVGSVNAADDWTCAVVATDTESQNSTAVTDLIEVNELQAISVTPLAINYGSMAPGTDSGAVNQTITVINAGNINTDTDISGSAMVGSATISIGQQKYNLTPFNVATTGTVLSATATTLDVLLPQQTNDASVVQDAIEWGIILPTGLPAGAYSGDVDITSV